MKRFTATRMLLAGFASLLLLAGCGGGESSSIQGQESLVPGSVLTWTPPTAYNDNATLDPERDLDYYEIYVRQDPNFTDGDQPLVQVAAVSSGSPVTEFTLDLIPSLPAGGQLYVSMRAVGVDKQKSTFMAPLTWNRS